MRYLFISALLIMSLVGCRSTKKIVSVIAPKDSTLINMVNQDADSTLLINSTLAGMKNNFIDFETFSSKIKVDVEDSKGKQPDITAVVRIIKDSTIWISLSATFLNIEIYRVLIQKNKVILLNKQDKEVQYRTIDYLQEVTQIPFDYKTLENMLIGNPVFFSDSILSMRRHENSVTLLSIGRFFKNLLTLSASDNLLVHSKLDDVDMYRNRTADISYGDYENSGGKYFSTSRHIVVSEKTKMDIRLRFKQVEFNKELSVAFNVPRNYKSK